MLVDDDDDDEDDGDNDGGDDDNDDDDSDDDDDDYDQDEDDGGSDNDEDDSNDDDVLTGHGVYRRQASKCFDSSSSSEDFNQTVECQQLSSACYNSCYIDANSNYSSEQQQQ